MLSNYFNTKSRACKASFNIRFSSSRRPKAVSKDEGSHPFFYFPSPRSVEQVFEPGQLTAAPVAIPAPVFAASVLIAAMLAPIMFAGTIFPLAPVRTCVRMPVLIPEVVFVPILAIRLKPGIPIVSCLLLWRGILLKTALNYLVQFSAIKPHTPALGAIVDFDGLALGHNQSNQTNRTFHSGFFGGTGVED